MRRSTYNTANRAILISFLARERERQFTVESLFAALSTEGIAIGKSSLYRILEKLCASGEVRKFTEGESAVFQYIGDDSACASHLHLKCLVCGKLIHLECDKSGELLSHIAKDHGFDINSKRSVLYGHCRVCRQKEELRARTDEKAD